MSKTAENTYEEGLRKAAEFLKREYSLLDVKDFTPELYYSAMDRYASLHSKGLQQENEGLRDKVMWLEDSLGMESGRVRDFAKENYRLREDIEKLITGNAQLRHNQEKAESQIADLSARVKEAEEEVATISIQLNESGYHDYEKLKRQMDNLVEALREVDRHSSPFIKRIIEKALNQIIK